MVTRRLRAEIGFKAASPVCLPERIFRSLFDGFFWGRGGVGWVEIVPAEVPKGGQPVTDHSEVAYGALPLALLSTQ